MIRALPVFLLALLACTPKPAPVAEVVAPPPVDPLDTRPTVAPAAAFVPPTPVVAALANGIPVWVLSAPALPIFNLQLNVPGGSQFDAPGREGTAALTMEAMRRGAGKLDGASFAAEVERRGLSISGGAGPDGSYLNVVGPSDQLGAALDLLADMVLRPRFDGAEIKKARELLDAGLQQGLSEPAYVADRTATSLYWGPTHPYGRPPDGTAKGLKASTPVEVRKWHASVWKSAAKGANFTIAGDVTTEAAVELIGARFGTWASAKPIGEPVQPAPKHEKEPIYLVDAPGSAQTGFYVAFPGLREGAPEEGPTQLGTIVLGGTFTSRLNALLREKRGYTYGVRAAVYSQREAGTLTVRTRIRTDVTADALVDLLGELDSIQKGITADELAKAQGAARQDVVEALQTQSGAAGTYADYLAAGRPASAFADELAGLNAVTVEAVTPAMAAWNKDHAVFVLVGDRAVIEPQLRERGFTNLAVVSPP
jgi:zinc protease